MCLKEMVQTYRCDHLKPYLCAKGCTTNTETKIEPLDEIASFALNSNRFPGFYYSNACEHPCEHPWLCFLGITLGAWWCMVLYYLLSRDSCDINSLQATKWAGSDVNHSQELILSLLRPGNGNCALVLYLWASKWLQAKPSPWLNDQRAAVWVDLHWSGAPLWGKTSKTV